MSFAKKIIAEKTASLQLLKAYTADDKPFFAYILIRENNLEILKAQKEGVLLTLPTNTIVLYSDFGSAIPDGIESRVIQQFYTYLKESK